MMRAAVIVFPGSNCDRDMKVALEAVTGSPTTMVWHGDADLPSCDVIVLPGGFSYGDYLRCGAMAAKSPIMRAVVDRAKAGTPLLGVCNGFQILLETGLLPGALMRNASLKFICRDTWLKCENTDTFFTNCYRDGETVRIPVAHHDGNYFASENEISQLEDNNQIVFRYCDADGNVIPEANPNGSVANIAGISDTTGRIVGMMPHPERLFERALGGTDGRRIFESALVAATNATV